MGVELQAVVEFVRGHSSGTPAVDLARLNLLVGRALSRNAATIADDPELVRRAWQHAREIVGDHGGEGRR